jgi:DegV family protein with EDD domain
VNLTAANTAIVLDSTSDYPEAAARADGHDNVRVVPLHVLFKDAAGQTVDDVLDHTGIDGHTFYERMAAAPHLPSTSQPTPGEFLRAYEELAGYQRIYSLHLSAKLSGTYASAVQAAGVAGADRVRLVDAETASLAVALLARAIERRLARGTTDAEIEALIDRFKRENRVVFTVGTLENLQKGGRIGKAQALVGSLLSVKPILTVEDGVIVPVGKVRGRQKALAEFRRLFEEGTSDAPGLRIAIAHADAPDWIEEIGAIVREVRPQATVELVQLLGAVVGTHAGPGAVGFFWFSDPELA